MAGCGGLKKMKKKAGEVQYTVSPSPLEMHADSVALSISGKYPVKYFGRKATLELTPVLKYEGGESQFQMVKIQGEKVPENNTVIKYKEGGGFSYTHKIPFVDGMRISDLEVRIVGKQKSKVVPFDPMVIGKGVIATPALVKIDPRPIVGKDKFQRITSEVVEGDIAYNLQQSTPKSGENNGADIKNLKSLIDESQKNERLVIKGVNVDGKASWDGNIDEINKPLADKRAKNANEFVLNFLFKKIEKVKEQGFVSAKTTDEDWAGFEAALKASTLPDKDVILNVLKMHSDLEVRERELKKLATVYLELKKDVLPQQRRSVIGLNIDHVGHSDEELNMLFDTNPDSLKAEEILYTATLTKDANRKLKVYQFYAKKFSNDWRGHNNVGMAYIMLNKVSDAKSAFEEARKLDDKNTIIQNNLGVVSLMEGNVPDAETKFKSASGAGNEVNYNLGIVNIKKANYEAAVGFFGSECTFNGALALVLNGKQDEAIKKIDCAENNDQAIMYYLKAVAGARKGDSDVMFNNLRAAVSKDASFAEKAKKDMEFFKFFGDDTFKSIVK
ncbi:MAG TPA: hypothetical protein DEA97_13775 [Bacteroidales bacterium]|nr:hypothetical protein [Bacteroidales bacterium]